MGKILSFDKNVVQIQFFTKMSAIELYKQSEVILLSNASFIG